MARRTKRRKAGGKGIGHFVSRLRRRLTHGGGGRRQQRMPSRWWPSPRIWVAITFLAGIFFGAIGLHAVSQLNARRGEMSVAEVPADPVAPPPPAPVGEAPETASAPEPASTAAYEETAPAIDPAATVAASQSVPVPEVPGPGEAELAALRALPAASNWLANALPFVDTGGRPMVAIIIDDVGVDRTNSPGAIALPAPVTLSFMSYADDLAVMTAEARRAGHELMLHLPMEPMDPTVDPGPHGLRIGQSPAEIAANVEWGLARFDGYIGVNNHMGSRFSRSTGAMAVVLAELRRRGLMFLDSRTVADSVGASVAADLGVPTLVRDVFLDNDPAPAAIEAQLAELERLARERGYAIGIGHPYPSTLAALNAWLPMLERRGIVAVPVSTILRRKLGVAG